MFDTNGNALTLAGPLSGPGGLQVAGSGTLTLAVYVDNGLLTLVGCQDGILNNTYSVELTTLGGVEAEMNGESVVFDPGEINAVSVFGNYFHDSLHIGPGILGNIPVGFSTHGSAQPFVFNGSQLTIQGDQPLGTSNNDTISLGQFGAGGVQAAIDGDTVQFDPGEINTIQVNLGSGNDNIQITDDLPAVVSSISFANIGAPGNDTLDIGNASAVTDATYTVGYTGMGLGDPFDIDCTGWLNPVAYLSNFTAVTLDMASGSAGGDTNVVNVANLNAATTLNVELGLGSENVVLGDNRGLNNVLGNVNITDDPNPGPSTINIVLNDQGDTMSRDISLLNGAPGWGSITGFGSSGAPQIDYQYSAATTLTVDSDAAVGNSINVNETGVTTDVQIDAVTYVSLGDLNAGTQGLLGSVNLSSYEGGTPDQGNLYLTLDDLADATPRTATLTTFYPEVSYSSGFFGPDTAWGLISGMTPSPATISYEYADTNSVTIEGNPGDQIVNHQTGKGQPPVTLDTAPVITSINPNEGPLGGGTLVAIHGSGFTGSPWVSFGNTVVLPNNQSTSSVLYVISPSNSKAGAVNLYVWNNITLSSPVQFTYVAAPTVTFVSPSVGPVTQGNMVTIHGQDFGGATVVDFGRTPATSFTNTYYPPVQKGSVFVPGHWEIIATAPAGTPGTVQVTVTTAGGPSNSEPYTFTAAPVVDSVYPPYAPLTGGITVSISGGNFSGATQVLFGSTPATSFAVVSSGEISAVSPAEPAGTVDVRIVTAAGGESAADPNDDSFTYLPPPTVTSISPTFGPYEGGTSVTINGMYLESLFPVVRFGAVAGKITSDNGTQIAVTSPANTGVVDVTVSTTGGTSATTSADKFTYLATPTVTSISPVAGPEEGGTSVTIVGTDLAGATEVDFGGIPSPNFTINTNGTMVTAISPDLGLAGSVYVTVTVAGSTSATSTADEFTYANLPIVTGMSLSSGPTGGGTTLTLSGSNLGGAMAVDFGGVAGKIDPVLETSGFLQVTSPAHSAGTVDVTVTGPLGTSADNPPGDQFTYYVPAAAPIVTGLSPSSVSVGVQTTVIISGSGLSDPTQVDFGGVPDQFQVLSDTQISVVCPASNTPGSVPVTVTTAAGTSAPVPFTYYGAAPTILGLYRLDGSPSNVGPANYTDPSGWEIAIYGENLGGATEVDFGGQAVTSFLLDTDTGINLIVPEEGPGTVQVTVTTPSGISASVPYTFSAAPVFIDFDGDLPYAPLSGNTPLMIRGIDMANATAVDFGNTPVTSFTYTPYDASGQFGALSLTTPPGVAGTVDVTVVSPEGTSAIVQPDDQFTYLSVPTITAISPASGPLAGGNLVAITGTGFSDIAENITVNFGDATTSPFSSAGNTIYVAAPAGSSLDTVNVTVTTPGGTSSTSSADEYTYEPAPVVSGLSVPSGLTPASGAVEGGTPVTISGSGLSDITAVDFGSVPADLSNLTYNWDGSVTVISPPAAYNDNTGGLGPVDVTVTTGDGTSIINEPADEFNYTNAPYVTSLGTTTGLVTGGTSVTIHGDGDSLEGATAVTFGGVAAPFVDNGDGTLTATSPPGTGTVHVLVTTPVGTSDPNNFDQFTYSDFPSVASVGPPTGSTDGTTQVTITGIGLANATEVTFGGFGTAYTFVSDTYVQIMVDAPATLDTGTVDVTVTTPLGTSAVNPPDDQFTYVAPPAITSLSPDSGPVDTGTQVTITGTALAGATEVDFGSNPVAEIVSNTDNQGIDTLVVLCTAATGDAPGPVDVSVTTPYGVATDSNAFTYALAPAVTSISPTSGPAGGGTTVIISGANLSGVSAVDFGGVAATSFWDNGDGTYSAVSPGAAPGLAVDVTVVTSGGASAADPANDLFTYLTAPTVTNISPSAGPEAGGTSVTITGTDLAGATEVDFSAPYLLYQVTSFTVNPLEGTITVPSPDVGFVGTFDVTVVTPGGTSATSTADEFTYDAPPTVTGVSPSWGSTMGATVTITGTNLGDANAIYFGGIPGAITSYSADQLQAVAPAGSPGWVDVTVVTPGGTSATNPPFDQFFYVGAPVAAADSYSVAADTTLTVPGPGVLANDTDPQGDPLTATLLAEPLDGTLSLGSDGSFTYTPNAGFVGTDGFVYQAGNGYLTSDATLVSITVSPATLTWDGVPTGDWTDSQWTGSPPSYPDSGVNAIVDTPSVVQVTSAQAANALAISGGGQVAVAAGATLAVTTDTSVTGGAMLSVDPDGSFSTGGTFTLDTGGSVTGGPVTAAAYQLNDGTASAGLTGSGGVTKDAGGNDNTVIASGINTYAGPTTINNGTYVITSANSLPAGTSLVVAAGGTFVFDPSQAGSNPLAVGLAAPAPDTAAAPETPTPIVAASGLAQVPATTSVLSTLSPAISATSGSPSATPPDVATALATPEKVSRVASAAIFGSHRPALDQTLTPADSAHNALPWAWLAALESFGNSPDQNKMTASAVAALDEVLARYGT